MGRSQVLYNRTKGRNTNRGGRGGRGRNDEGGTDNGGRGRIDRSNHDGWKQKQHQSKATSRIYSNNNNNNSNEKDYENEYELLLAGRNTFLSSKNRAFSTKEKEQDHGSFGTTSICIPSMAATLSTLSISRRLRMPLHVVASAFPSRFPEEQEQKEKEDEREHGREREAQTSSSTDVSTIEEVMDDRLLNLESWLDDECGDTQQPRSARIRSSPVAVAGSDLPSQTRDARINKASEDDSLLANSNSNEDMKNGNEEEVIVEETKEDGGDDDELDDWLDSVIE